jgi:hypothetical protein
MRGVVPIVLVVGVTALVGCGGSDDNGATPAELNQARKEGAQQERGEQRLRRLERQLKNLKKGQKGKPPPGGSSPPGATGGSTSCGGDLSVGPNTTCGFAQNVQSDYYYEIGSGSGTVNSYSPTTGETYAMSCTAGAPHVCTGGNNASVYFP